MKNYIGTKELQATPMTLGDYNEKRGWTIPENEDPKREGYLVQYSDDYISWSPKEIFEASYIETNLNKIAKSFEKPHEQRVSIEAIELLENITKLGVFITENDFFKILPEDEQTRMKLQLASMTCYYSVLVERTEHFTSTVDLIQSNKQALGMSFEEAEKALKNGFCIALPEWGGFWFVNYKNLEILVLTKDGEITNTPHEEYKERTDWIIVTPNDEQLKLMKSYISKKLTFGEAIQELKSGKLITRSGWNGKNMFVFKQIPNTVEKENIPKMISFPDNAKNELIGREQSVSFNSVMLIINSSGRADSWVPSSSDCFAEDWQILE